MTTLREHVTEMGQNLAAHQHELEEAASYYEADHRLKAIGVSTPPEMRNLIAQIGWPRTYIDSIEERLDIEGFRLAGSDEADERLWSWWQSNNMDVESGLAHTDALIYGRSFVTVSAGDNNIPVIRAESPLNMWADIDPVTRRVTRAVRFYQSPYEPVARGATLFLPDRTVLLSRNREGTSEWEVTRTIRHDLGVVPVVPVVNRARLARATPYGDYLPGLYGQSEITPELRSVTDAAARIMMNMQAAAELMAVPQRLLFGVAQEALGSSDSASTALEAYYARIIAVEDADAHATQFSAAELRNFTEVLQELSKQAASYTGLPPQYLSFSTENPASAEAIRSSEARLVKKCERKARTFGGAWEEVMRLAMLIVDGFIPESAYRMETLWRDPATPTFAAKADAVTKLYANGQGIIPKERARVDLGYSVEERRQMEQWDRESPAAMLAGLYGSAVTPSEEANE